MVAETSTSVATEGCHDPVGGVVVDVPGGVGEEPTADEQPCPRLRGEGGGTDDQDDEEQGRGLQRWRSGRSPPAADEAVDRECCDDGQHRGRGVEGREAEADADHGEGDREQRPGCLAAGERGGAQVDEPGRGEHLCCLDCACETHPEGERQAARVPDLGRCRPATHERRPATNQSRVDQAVSSGAIGSGGRSPRCPALPVADVRCACQLPAVPPSGVSGRISRTPLPTGSTASGRGGEACGGDDLQCSGPSRRPPRRGWATW